MIHAKRAHGGVHGFLLHRYIFGNDDLLGIASGPGHLLHAYIRLCPLEFPW